MFFSELVFFVLLVGGVRGDLHPGEPSSQCTYPVSHNWMRPKIKYKISAKRYDSATAETCQDYCNEDMKCKSVEYRVKKIKNTNNSRTWCRKFNTTIPELKKNGKDGDVKTVTKTNKLRTLVTYDKYCGASQCGQPSIPPKNRFRRIVGGTGATPGSWPWHISMEYLELDYYEQQHLYWCGGTIISDKWILTAADCFDINGSPLNYSIRVGDHNKTGQDEFQVTHNISSIVVHENYSDSTYDNDIALVQVTVPIQFNDHVSPVCLPNPGDQLEEGDYGYITGFGETNDTGFADVLKQTSVPIRNQEKCNDNYKDPEDYKQQKITLTENMFCAGSKGNSTCWDDLGGPLVFKSNSIWSIHGIASFHYDCGTNPELPGVYTKVVNYLDWIREKMEKTT